jgi:hypothetical protein
VTATSQSGQASVSPESWRFGGGFTGVCAAGSLPAPGRCSAARRAALQRVRSVLEAEREIDRPAVEGAGRLAASSRQTDLQAPVRNSGADQT